MQEQFFPQMDPEPEMGAAAATEYDTSPPLLRNLPPSLAETAHAGASDIAQLFAMLAGMRGETQQMNQNIIGSTQMLREEMQCMGAGLQEGQDQIRGEIGKNTTAIKEFKIGQGEVLRATCWGRLAKVTEEVTVTQWEKLNWVTETCTREIRHVEMTEYTETREIEGELDRVSDAHTHTEVARDNGSELAQRVETRCG